MWNTLVLLSSWECFMVILTPVFLRKRYAFLNIFYFSQSSQTAHMFYLWKKNQIIWSIQVPAFVEYLFLCYSSIKIFTYSLFWKAIWRQKKDSYEKQEEKQSLLGKISQTLANYWVEWSYYLFCVLIKCTWIHL